MGSQNINDIAAELSRLTRSLQEEVRHVELLEDRIDTLRRRRRRRSPPLRRDPDDDPPVDLDDPPRDGSYNELEPPELHRPAEPQFVATPGDDLEEAARSLLSANVSPVLGISGKHAGGIRLAHRYGAHAGGAPIRLTLKGVDDDAEIRGLTFYADEGRTDHFEAWDLKVATPYGSRAPITDIAKSTDLVFKGVSLLPDVDNMDAYGGAGMKWGFDLGDGTDYLHIEDCPRQPGSRFEEHWAYIKSPGSLYIIRNDMSGGNRTGFQIRTPHYKEAPHGPILIAENGLIDYGWDWDFNNGGYGMTVWENPFFLTEIRNNVVINAKYGCLVIAKQPEGQYGWETPAGYAHKRVLIHGNAFSAPAGDRNVVSMNHAEKIELKGDNEFGPTSGSGFDIVIDSATSQKWGAKPCLDVELDDKYWRGQADGSFEIKTWDGDNYVDYPLP